MKKIGLLALVLSVMVPCAFAQVHELVMPRSLGWNEFQAQEEAKKSLELDKAVRARLQREAAEQAKRDAAAQQVRTEEMDAMLKKYNAVFAAFPETTQKLLAAKATPENMEKSARVLGMLKQIRDIFIVAVEEKPLHRLQSILNLYDTLFENFASNTDKDVQFVTSSPEIVYILGIEMEQHINAGWCKGEPVILSAYIGEYLPVARYAWAVPQPSDELEVFRQVLLDLDK